MLQNLQNPYDWMVIIICRNGEQEADVCYSTLGFQAVNAANAICICAPILKKIILHPITHKLK